MWVGLLGQNGSLHERATALLAQMQRNGDQPVGRVRDQIHAWLEAGVVTFVHDAVAELFEEIVDATEASNANLAGMADFRSIT